MDDKQKISLKSAAGVGLTTAILTLYFVLPSHYPKMPLWGWQILLFLIPSFLFLVLAWPQQAARWFGALSPAQIARIALQTIALSLILHVMAYYWSQYFAPAESVRAFYDAIPQPHSFVDWAILFSGMALLPAVAEELLFRGMFFESMRNKGKILTVGFTTILFTFCHFNPSYVPFYLVLGLYLAYLRYSHQSLLAPIWAHALNNIIALLAWNLVRG